MVETPLPSGYKEMPSGHVVFESTERRTPKAPVVEELLPPVAPEPVSEEIYEHPRPPVIDEETTTIGGLSARIRLRRLARLERKIQRGSVVGGGNQALAEILSAPYEVKQFEFDFDTPDDRKMWGARRRAGNQIYKPNPRPIMGVPATVTGARSVSGEPVAYSLQGKKARRLATRTMERQAEANVLGNEQFKLRLTWGKDIGSEGFVDRVRNDPNMDRRTKRRALKAHRNYIRMHHHQHKMEHMIEDTAHGAGRQYRKNEKRQNKAEQMRAKLYPDRIELPDVPEKFQTALTEAENNNDVGRMRLLYLDARSRFDERRGTDESISMLLASSRAYGSRLERITGESTVSLAYIAGERQWLQDRLDSLPSTPENSLKDDFMYTVSLHDEHGSYTRWLRQELEARINELDGQATVLRRSNLALNELRFSEGAALAMANPSEAKFGPNNSITRETTMNGIRGRWTIHQNGSAILHGRKHKETQFPAHGDLGVVRKPKRSTLLWHISKAGEFRSSRRAEASERFDQRDKDEIARTQARLQRQKRREARERSRRPPKSLLPPSRPGGAVA